MKNLNSHIIVSLFPILLITGNMSAQQAATYNDDVYDVGKPSTTESSDNASAPADSSAYYDQNDSYYGHYRSPYVVYGGYNDPFFYPHPFWSFWPFYGYYHPHPFWGWGGGWGGWGWHHHGNYYAGGDSYYGNRRSGNGRGNGRTSSFYGQRRSISASRSTSGTEHRGMLSHGRSEVGTRQPRSSSPNRSILGSGQNRQFSQGRSSMGTAHSRPSSARGGFGSIGRSGFSSGS